MSKSLVVVTGASSGIGAAIAKKFSQAGHPLLLLARRVEKLEELGLPNTVCSKVDVTDAEAFSQAVRDAEAEHGPADCLVNCAGLMLLGDVATQKEDEWRKMYDVNVLAVLNGMQAVLAPMKKRNHGTIINISSTAGFRTYPDHAAYCGTKFAVHAITETVREEVANTGVRLITVAPGATETALLSHTSSEKIKEQYEGWKKEIGGVMDPDDVARAVIFAYEQPQEVCVREIVLTATGQSA